MAGANALRDQITALFRDSLHVDVPSPDTDLFDGGILDSLAFVELLLELERRFGVTAAVDDLEVDNFRTIDCIAEYVLARAAAALTFDEEVAHRLTA
jgi:D-alanine--poly(phosphoribitol) ligase subunit 2